MGPTLLGLFERLSVLRKIKPTLKNKRLNQGNNYDTPRMRVKRCFEKVKYQCEGSGNVDVTRRW